MGRIAVIVFFLLFTFMYCTVCFGVDFSGVAVMSGPVADSSGDAGEWQSVGAGMERVTEISSTTEQTDSRWETGDPSSVTSEPFTEPAVEGGTWSGEVITTCSPVTEWGTFVTTETFNVETLQPYSSLKIDTSTGSKPAVDVTKALPAVPFDFASFAADKIPTGNRPQVMGSDGNPRYAFAFEAKPFDFAGAMAKAAFSSERPVQLAGTAGGNTLKTSSFNLVTSTRIETTTEERKVNEFTRCETDTVYEQYTKPPPPPPAPSPTPTPSGGGGDGGDDYDGPSPGNYFYKAPDSPSKGIGGSGGAETLDDALNQLPHDDLGNHLGTVTPR